MTQDGDNAVVPAAPDRERALVPTVRETVRTLAAATDDAIATTVGKVGHAAIRRAADASIRLGAVSATDAGAAQLLGEIEALAAGLAGPAASAEPERSGWFGRSRPAAAPTPTPELRLGPLIARIETERDRVAQSLIALAADRERIATADRDLEDAVHLVRALRTGLAAAARELRSTEPARAARLEAAAPLLVERERDLLTQIVVTRQGLLTLDLALGQRETLADALTRARTITLAALQTRAAAGRAVDMGR